MRYSLNDFRRAADRHMGNMEMSRAARDRLTQPRRARSLTLSAVGWAAAAACLVLLLMSLPLGARRAPGEGGQPDRAPLSASTGDALPSAAPPEPLPTAGAPRRTGVAAASQALLARSDARTVLYDHSGLPYVIDDGGAPGPDSCYTGDEVLATGEGRAYYDARPGETFLAALWPRPERVTFLPALEDADWQQYYIELGVGTVTQRSADYGPSGTPYALAGPDGLITGFIFCEIREFTVDGCAAASLPAGSADWAIARWGFIGAGGAWASEPLTGRLDTIYMEDDSGESRPTYYALGLCAPQDAESAPVCDEWRICDLSGRVLFTAAEIDNMLGAFTGELTAFRAEADGKWGYVDRDLNAILPPTYEYAWPFCEGLAAVGVRTDDGVRFGFIDMSGNVVIEPQYLMVDWPGFSGGYVRVRDEGLDVWHTIDVHGNDVSDPLSLIWQRVERFVEQMPLNTALMGWALFCLALTLAGAGRVRSYRDGPDAPRRRALLGYAALGALALGGAAIGEPLHSALPDWLLTQRGADGPLVVAAAALMALSGACGFIYGWSLGQRRRAARLLMPIIVPLALAAVRLLMGASTVLDWDMAALFALGGLMGALRPAYAEGTEPLPPRTRLICVLLCAALSLGAPGLAARDWDGLAAMSGASASLTPLSAEENLRRYSSLRDDPPLSEEDMAFSYGEDWRGELDALLAAPGDWAVLAFEVRLSNPSLRPVRAQLVCPWLAAPGEADAGDALLARLRFGSRCEYAYSAVEPFAGDVVTFRYIVDADVMEDAAWLAEATARLREAIVG